MRTLKAQTGGACQDRPPVPAFSFPQGWLLRPPHLPPARPTCLRDLGPRVPAARPVLSDSITELVQATDNHPLLQRSGTRASFLLTFVRKGKGSSDPLTTTLRAFVSGALAGGPRRFSPERVPWTPVTADGDAGCRRRSCLTVKMQTQPPRKGARSTRGSTDFQSRHRNLPSSCTPHAARLVQRKAGPVPGLRQEDGLGP